MKRVNKLLFVSICVTIFLFILLISNNNNNNKNNNPKNDIPIVFFVENAHSPCVKGVNSMVHMAVTQAALYNDRIIIVGCKLLAQFVEENNHNFPWSSVQVYDLERYLDDPDVLDFKKNYFSGDIPKVDDSSLRRFEFICFQRWLILSKLMNDAQLEYIAAMDNDVLLYTNMTEYFNVNRGAHRADLYLSFLPHRVSGHTSIVSRRALLEIVDFIRDGMKSLRASGDSRRSNDMEFLRYYSYKAINDKLRQHGDVFDYKEQCWVTESYETCREYSNFGLSEPWKSLKSSFVPVSLTQKQLFKAPVFTYLGERQFSWGYREESTNGHRYRRDVGALDHNFDHDPELQYETNKDRTKVVYWINRFPYFKRFDTPYLIAAMGLHFQGVKKKMMSRYIQRRRPRFNDPPCFCISTEADDCQSCR